MSVIISGNSGAAEYFGNNVFEVGEVIAVHGTSLLRASGSVLIIGKNAELPSHISVFAAVVDADSDFDCECLRGTAVISCGMSGRNTVSITSCTNESITLSLNRSIMTLAGICEPFELPIRRLRGTTNHDCMAAFAAAVLQGTAGH